MAGTAATLLKDYHAKRDFSKTAEPSGDVAGGTEGMFVVQKHDATRLHYDFRLELDGVLKSWAVTRGPSLDPADKRLSVRTEDHPMSYGHFEGTIPAGQYGGGTVMLWELGTWEPTEDPHKGIAEGRLKFRLHGQRMKGLWALIRMKPRPKEKHENWLLIKDDDEFADREKSITDTFTTSVETGRDLEGIAKGLKSKKRAAAKTLAPKAEKPKPAAKASAAIAHKGLPAFRAPQLATLVDDVPAGTGWLFEMKYDGYRALAAINATDVQIFTRNENDWTQQFGRLVEPLSRLTKGSALIDGEICAFDEKGRTDFSTLKDALSEGGPLVYFAFDLLELDGEDLTKLPLIERKEKLKALLGPIEENAQILFSDHVRGSGEKVFKALCEGGHEGVIAKQADAPYRGERTKSWLKVKCIKRQEFVIAGWRPSSKRNHFASLLLGTWEDGKLVYRGRVGTGFNAASSEALQNKLDALAAEKPAFDSVPREIARAARWVKPELVGEIAFAEFTPDGVLRHPSFVGLREDKPATEIRRETAVPVAEAKADKPARPAKKPSVTLITDAAGIAAAEGAHVRLTSPDRVVFPGQGVTKADLAAYYAAVADVMLPHVANRPLSLVRCPQGRAKYCFFQKHDSGGFPEAFKKVAITEKDGGKEDYLYIEDLAGLIGGVQMNALEFHIWGARNDDVEKPERIIFDIDPDEGLGFDAVRDAAFDIAALLDTIGLETFPLVSGGKGVHVIAPLVPGAEWPEIKAFCKLIAQTMADREPDRFTAALSKARRKGRMFIDYLRNERGSTAIAPWSTRSRDGAPVAVPVTWDELKTIPAANAFSLEAAAARASQPDPWKDYFTTKQKLTAKMLDKF